jgi:hypothetical protein
MRRKGFSPAGAVVTLASVQLVLGCQLVSQPDPLQKEIFNQPRLSDGGVDRNPDPVLRLIPVGTPVEQARAVMEAHGFHCSDDRRSGPATLECKAHSYLGCLVTEYIRVTLYLEAGKVSRAEVVAYATGL